MTVDCGRSGKLSLKLACAAELAEPDRDLALLAPDDVVNLEDVRLARIAIPTSASIGISRSPNASHCSPYGSSGGSVSVTV
jgi:hypothetical protein